jgi:hypothetical protein
MAVGGMFGATPHGRVHGISTNRGSVFRVDDCAFASVAPPIKAAAIVVSRRPQCCLPLPIIHLDNLSAARQWRESHAIRARADLRNL